MNDDPMHVPRSPLKLFTAGMVAAFIIAPLVAALRSGNPGNLIALVGGGLAVVGCVICSMYLYRLVLWFVFAFYWYIAAVFSVFLLILSLVYMSNLVAMPALPDTMNIDPVTNGLIVAGAVVGLVVIYFVFKPQRKTPPPSSAPAAPPKVSSKQKILNTAQELAAQKNDFGFDEDN